MEEAINDSIAGEAALPETMLSLKSDTALFQSVVGQDVPMSISEDAATYFSEIADEMHHGGLPGREYYSSPVIVNVVSAMLILMFVLLSSRFLRGYKFFKLQFHHLFAVKLRENMFEDHTTINEIYAIVVCIVNSCVCQGIMQFYLMLHSGTVNFGMPMLWAALPISILGAGALYFFQSVAYSLLGYTFATTGQHSKIWKEGYVASQSLMGIIILPMVMALNITSGDVEMWLYMSIIAFILLRIAFIIKGFRIFFTKMQHALYFILYLCTVEIIPVLVEWIIITAICKHIIQS